MCDQVRLHAVGVGGGDLDADVHAAPPDMNDPCGDVDGVADDDGPVEADPGDVGRDDVRAGPAGPANPSRFVDPRHGLAAADSAATVDVGSGGEEAQRGAVGGARHGVTFGGHGAFDASTHRDPDP